MAISCKQTEVDFSQIASYLSDKTITISDIAGLNIPLANSSPRLSIVSNTQFSGDVKWYTVDGNKLEDGQLFAPDTVYIAYINLKPNKSWTLKGLTENFFKVPYAKSTSLSNDGVVTAVFPKSVLNYYTINFHIDDDDVIFAGGSLDPVEVPEGYPMAALPFAPRRFGKFFSCWNSAENLGGSDFFEDTLVIDNRFENLYPVWTPVPPDWTYDTATGGMRRDFSYSGSVQELKIPIDGNYKFELWGAEGGNVGSSRSGKGGYISGTKTLQANDTFYLFVGEKGQDSSYFYGKGGRSGRTGGWNGGGASGGTNDGWSDGASGGGATDVRTSKNSSATDAAIPSTDNRIIVAGGGGAAGVSTQATGGNGGVGSAAGGNGGAGYEPNFTQTGGSGGGTSGTGSKVGGNGTKNQDGGGGGGGGYRGGGGGTGCGYCYTSTRPANFGASAGGGGSSWADTSFSGLNAPKAGGGTNTGNGKVTVTYMP
ncbi:MAG: hypothetical protein Ta2B_04370 [Termitinemataceae bacterium]|nr:MAG: hypothetical protein Ta2B_04370 [Termitinemataceae bacterium]